MKGDRELLHKLRFSWGWGDIRGFWAETDITDFAKFPLVVVLTVACRGRGLKPWDLIDISTSSAEVMVLLTWAWSASGEKRSDSGCTLKVEPQGFLTYWVRVWERRVKEDSKGLGLSRWKKGVDTSWNGEGHRGVGLEGTRNQESSFRLNELKPSLRGVSRDVE